LGGVVHSEVVMGWFKGDSKAEYSHGESGKVSDAWLKEKTDDSGKVTDVVVGKDGESSHDHYWDTDKGESGGRQEVDWGGGKK
jgi:hypothetical protein